MKGGITSGIVYPPAILHLKDKYRFRSIGGASVGAIAAAVTAAAEYGRQMRTGGFDALATISQELPSPGFLQSLFQPKKELAGLYRLVIESTKRTWSRPYRIVWAILRERPLLSLLSAVAWFGTGVFALANDRGEAIAVLALMWSLLVVPLAMVFTRGSVRWSSLLWGPLSFVVTPPLLPPILWMALRSFSRLNEPGFGMCTGMPVTGGSTALTTWLHEKIQASAGLETPLTFRDLESAGVQLEVMSTDLSSARPIVLPRDFGDYHFDEGTIRELFPDDVIQLLISHSIQNTDDPRLWRIEDVRDLPVLVAFRLSMSFPVLFVAVPLFGPGARREGGTVRLVERWISDGGIGSNFPIHFFDRGFPRHPTFGLSLGSYPQDADGLPIMDEDIYLPVSPTDELAQRWTGISGVIGLLRQLLDTMENWRDTLQSELPGFSDRVCQIYLRGDEGGLNLGMQPEAIRSLIDKGGEAGLKLSTVFNWDQHRFTRYALLMQMLERGLLGELAMDGTAGPGGVRGVLAPYLDALETGTVDPRGIYLWGRDETWLQPAAVSARELLKVAATWAPPPRGAREGEDLFDTEPRLGGRGVLRIVPRV